MIRVNEGELQGREFISLMKMEACYGRQISKKNHIC